MNLPQTNLEALEKMASVCDRSLAKHHATLLKSAVAEIKAMRNLLAQAKKG